VDKRSECLDQAKPLADSSSLAKLTADSLKKYLSFLALISLRSRASPALSVADWFFLPDLSSTSGAGNHKGLLEVSYIISGGLLPVEVC